MRSAGRLHEKEVGHIQRGDSKRVEKLGGQSRWKFIDDAIDGWKRGDIAPAAIHLITRTFAGTGRKLQPMELDAMSSGEADS